MDPAITGSEQWLADYRKTVARAAANAQAAGQTVRQLAGSATSARGEVVVRVDGGGALTGLELTPAARALEAGQLAQLILATARQAQRAVGAQVVEIMTGYLGDGPALDFVKRNLPSDTTAPVAGTPAAADDDYYFADFPEIVR